MQASRSEAEKDQVVVPTTMEEYCMKPKKPAPTSQQENIEIDDFYDDDCYDMDDDDDDDDEDDDDAEDEEDLEEDEENQQGGAEAKVSQ